MWVLARLLMIGAICTLLIARPEPAAAQSSCTVIYVGSGWGPVSVNVPSWATQIRAEVDWSGLQLRLFVDGTVHGIAMFGDPVVETGIASWGGSRVIEFGGIMIDSVGAWTLYACGSPPLTPTPTPAPTATPMVADGPGCVSRVGEPAEWVSDSLTIYGPPSGWYVLNVYEDQGASGAQGVRWRLTRTGGYITPPPEERRGDAILEVGRGESITITILGADGPGIPGLWVAVSAVCAGLEATPVAPGADDIRPVEFGVVVEGQDCPWELPRVVFSFTPPFLPAVNLDFPGVRVCFIYKRLLLGWGDFNVMDWALPLFAVGFVWAGWLALRRG